MKYIVMLFAILFTFSAMAADITPKGMKQSDLVTYLYETDQNTRYCAMNSGTLVESAGTPNAIKLTTAVKYRADGIYGEIGTYEGILVSSPAKTQAVSTTSYYVFSYDVTNSTTEIYTVADGRSLTESMKAVPDGNVVYGYLKIVTGAAATFKMGTTDLGAAGVTDTFYNVSGRSRSVTLSLTD